MWTAGESIDSSEDTIDSRDVIARIQELEEEREALVDAVTEAQEALDELQPDTYEGKLPFDLAVINANSKVSDVKTYLADFDGCDYEGEELVKLKEFAEEAEGYTSEWADGAYFIRATYFEEYAQEEAESMGLLENCNRWPATCIDWEKAADELKMDYSCIMFDGEEYWVRSC